MEVMHECNAHNFPLDLAADEVLTAGASSKCLNKNKIIYGDKILFL